MKQDTIRLIDILNSYREQVKNKEDYTNHWLRRFYRCFIDGSYLGQEHYQNNCNRLKAIKGNIRKLRSFVIENFVRFLKQEYDLSPSTIQKTILKTIPSDELTALNDELIDDSLDLITDLD